MRPLLLSLLLLTPIALADDPQVETRLVASSLDLPVAIAHAGDSRLFFTLQRGQIVVYDGTRVLAAPFLDIRPLVLCCGERGLLSIAFHPRYRENGRFFVYYTDRNGDITIARYTVSANPDVADSSSGTVILRIPHPVNSNHNGGLLKFGPDGYLYFGTGDGGSGGDPPNNAQNLNSLLGKLLRIDVDSGSPYGIPPTNPFVTRPTNQARHEIWAFGLRNPWKFSFDRLTGDLWIGDVGQNRFEEIDFQAASSLGGENYGWRRMEASQCFSPTTNCREPDMILPVIEYGRSEGCSVTGGYRYRGDSFPRLRGMYIYGDYCQGTIWGATQQSNGSWLPRVLLSSGFSITSFGEDNVGEIYVTDHGANGSVHQIIDANPFPLPPRRRAAR